MPHGTVRGRSHSSSGSCQWPRTAQVVQAMLCRCGAQQQTTQPQPSPMPARPRTSACTTTFSNRCIRLINTFTHSTQLERGVSASWVASQGANNNPPIKQRIGADAAAGNLTAFFKANLEKLDLHIVKRLSLVLDFIESRAVIREKVDLLPATPTATFNAYTEGIVLCHDTVVMLAEVASLKSVAFRTLAITDLLEMKEGLGKHRGGFSAKLSKGELTVKSVMVCVISALCPLWCDVCRGMVVGEGVWVCA